MVKFPCLTRSLGVPDTKTYGPDRGFYKLFFPPDHELQKFRKKKAKSGFKDRLTRREKNSVENILSQCRKEIRLATKLKQPGLIALSGEPHRSN